MSSSMKNVMKPARFGILNQLRRYTCKISVDVDQSVLQKIENEDIKPKQQPGIVKFKNTPLPTNIYKALEKVVGDYPIKALLEDSYKLNRFISARHPPCEDKEIYNKVKIITDEIEELMPTENCSKLGEEEQNTWKQRKEQLLRKRLQERTYSWKPIQYGKYESIVYAVGRAAREFSVLMFILQEIKLRDAEFKPNSYFDFGSGIGTGMWATSSLWKDSIFEYFNVDSSTYMNELSELILSNGNDNQQITLPNVFYRQFLPGLETLYDLIICSYSLFEVPSSKERLNIILNLWKKCDDYLVIVEEGTLAGFNLVNEARDYILSLEEHSLIGHVFAPCPHDNICPRLSNTLDRTPCNFEVKFMSTNFSKKISNKTSTARFSYVVLKKGLPVDDTRLWPRLVRPTLVRSKHAICRMCTSEGKLQEVIFTKSKHSRAALRIGKASRWGDRLPMKIREIFEIETKKHDTKKNFNNLQ